MRSINLNRQLVGIEDLLIGFGTVMQTRGGQQTLVTKINAGSLPFDETQSLLQWAQTVNLEELGVIVDELTIVANNKDSIVAVSNNSVNINLVAGLNDEIASLYANLIAIQSNYTNITTLIDIHNNMANLLLIASQIIPNITEILNVDVLATQVANDKVAVETMKLSVETMYDTFDDRFLGSKVNDPTVDNDGEALIDGAMYFNTASNAMKVYDLGNTLWLTIPQIYLSGLLDVQLTSITTGDLLIWNGTKWVNTRTPKVDSIQLNGGTSTQGTAIWNNTDLTYDLVLNDNVTLQVGQEEVVYCKNNTLTTLPNGRPVMAVGTNGNSGNILVELHDGTKASAKRIIGLTTQPILPSNNINPYGFVTRNGKVRGLNTTGSDYGETWVDGDILYVKANGTLTKVEPADTALKMPIAFVIHAHTNGTLYVRTTGLDENHDRDLIATKVDKVSSTDNAVVRFNGVTGEVQNSGVIIDDNGNVGIGVTPSAWQSGVVTGVDVKDYYNYGASSVGGHGVNTYYNAGWKYKYSGTIPLNCEIGDGSFKWQVAPSGTAGSPITWTNAMTLDASGDLTINSGALRGSHGGGNITTNFAAGVNALISNTTGYNNTANGVSALANNTNGFNNTANGVSTLANNTNGFNNTANGVNALISNTTGYNNTANGVNALISNTTGAYNTANGVNALISNTTGAYNTVNGVSALANNTTGYNNTANGVSALANNTNGFNNTANGVEALISNTTGYNNTANGVNALANNTTFSNVSGFGYNSQVTGSNQIQLGDSATTTYVYGTVQNRSDLRDKADVRDTVLGLDFIKSLRPVDYKWDMREDYKTERPVVPDIEKPSEDDIEALDEYNRIQDEYKLEVEKWLEDNKLENIIKDGSKKRARYHQGFIAQEVQALGVEFGGIQDHSIKGGEDVLSIGYDEIIAPLVKAIQEMSAEYTAEINYLKARIEILEGAK